MAVRIRLKKMGRKHRPFFRVCAMDARAPRDGRVIEELGHYDPLIPETDARARLNGERIAYWLGVGAKPTPKVGVLIKKYGQGGTHLEQQKKAIEKLGQKRASQIALAQTMKAPKPEEKPAEDEAKPEEQAAAEGEAAEATEEAAAAETAAPEATSETAEATTETAEATETESAAEETETEATESDKKED